MTKSKTKCEKRSGNISTPCQPTVTPNPSLMKTLERIVISLVIALFTTGAFAETKPPAGTAPKNPAEEAGKPRVFIIGDSISLGYTPGVRKNLEGKAVVSRPAANCQHTGYGLANLKTWLGAGKWDVIHFNWGIWDTHMLDEKGGLLRAPEEAKAAVPMHIRYTPEQYRENLEQLVKILEGTGAKLIWASTTPVMSRAGKRFDDIRIRNEIAAEIMRAHKIATDDLYAFVLPHVKEWQEDDQVHFNATGNEKLAARVSESIEHALAGKGK